MQMKFYTVHSFVHAVLTKAVSVGSAAIASPLSNQASSWAAKLAFAPDSRLSK